MELSLSVIGDMFQELRARILAGDLLIYLYNSSDEELCNIEFDDIVTDSSFPNEFYFEYANSRVLRNTVGGSPYSNRTVSKFKIFESGSVLIMSGTVGLLNTNNDITFNDTEWEEGLLVIISQLKIVFPVET